MTSPVSGFKRPFIIFKRVVFPVPLSPIIATLSPLFISKFISQNNFL